MTDNKESSMRKIRLDKIVLNMGVGKSGEAIEVAKKAMDQITGKKSCSRDAKATQRDWGVRKGEPIGVAVTVRGDVAATLLKKLFDAIGNKVKGKSFDNFGNLSFGIKEHIDIPGIKYDPQIGILGLEAAISLTRPGFSIRVRSRHKASIGKKHKISRDEAIEFLTREFGVAVV